MKHARCLALIWSLLIMTTGEVIMVEIIVRCLYLIYSSVSYCSNRKVFLYKRERIFGHMFCYTPSYKANYLVFRCLFYYLSSVKLGEDLLIVAGLAEDFLLKRFFKDLPVVCSRNRKIASKICNSLSRMNRIIVFNHHVVFK
jgi:hypothetical protein